MARERPTPVRFSVMVRLVLAPSPPSTRSTPGDGMGYAPEEDTGEVKKPALAVLSRLVNAAKVDEDGQLILRPPFRQQHSERPAQLVQVEPFWVWVGSGRPDVGDADDGQASIATVEAGGGLDLLKSEEGLGRGGGVNLEVRGRPMGAVVRGGGRVMEEGGSVLGKCVRGVWVMVGVSTVDMSPFGEPHFRSLRL